MSMMGRQTMDQEKVSFNRAKLKKGGYDFEIAVDADLAIALKNGKDVDIIDVVRSEHIFSDLNKGELASETHLRQVFETTDVLKIAKRIILDGEINLTAQYRRKMHEEKRKRIINIIATNAIDPRTKLPHPPQRIENAFEEANIKIDPMRPADEQVDDIVKKLKPIMPISFDKKVIEVRIPAEYAGKAVNTILQFAKPKEEKWNADGSYSCVVELPAGLEADFYDKLNKLTGGFAETNVRE